MMPRFPYAFADAEFDGTVQVVKARANSPLCEALARQAVPRRNGDLARWPDHNHEEHRPGPLAVVPLPNRNEIQRFVFPGQRPVQNLRCTIQISEFNPHLPRIANAIASCGFLRSI